MASLNSVLYLLNPVTLLDSVDFHSPIALAQQQAGELWDSPRLFSFFYAPPIVQYLRTNGLIRTAMKIPQLFTPLEILPPALPHKEGKKKVFF